MLTWITQTLIALTVVLIFGMLGTLVLRRQSPTMRHAWLCSIMSGLIILPFLIPFLPIFAPVKKVEVVVEPIPPVVPPTMIQSEPTQLKSNTTITTPIPIQQQEISVNLPVEPVLTAARTPISESSGQETSKNPVPAMIFAVILIAGMLIRLTMLAASILATRRMAKNALVFQFGSDTLNLTEIRKCFHLRRDVPVLTHDQVEVPFAAGIIRPMIFLPGSMQNENAERLRLVLMHETAHIARRDVFWQLLSRVLLAMYWFHPLAWWLVRQIRQEREFACDDAVLLAEKQAVIRDGRQIASESRAVAMPEDYALVLLDISESLRLKNGLLSGCTVAMAGAHRIEKRIRAILDDTRMRKPVGRVSTFLLILFACSLTAFSGMFSPFEVEEIVHEPAKTGQKTVAETKTGETEAKVDVAESTKLGLFKTGKKSRYNPEADEYKIRGRILLPDGTPAANVNVFYFIDSGFDRAITDAKGYFTTMGFSPVFIPEGVLRGETDFVLEGIIPQAENASWQWAAAPFMLRNLARQPEEVFVIRLQKGVKVTGTLTSDDGKLPLHDEIRNVRVKTTLTDENNLEFQSSIWLKANEHGQFECWLTPGKYRFYPNETRWESVKKEVIIEEGDTEKTVELNLPIPSQVQVVCEDGTPVTENARLLATYVMNDSGDCLHSGLEAGRDEKGLATVYFSPSGNLVYHYDEKKRKGGVLFVAGKKVDGEETAGKTYTLTVRPWVRGKVRLVDAATGKSLSGVKLEYDPAAKSGNVVISSIHHHESQTDENGVAELTNIIPGANYLLRLRGLADVNPKHDWTISSDLQRILHQELNDRLLSIDVHAKPGETIDLGDVLVGEPKPNPVSMPETAVSSESEQKKTIITGRVLMPNGLPAKNASVVVSSRSTTNSAVHDAHAFTDQDGIYRIQLMPENELVTAQAYLSTFPEGVTPSIEAMYEGKQVFEPFVSEIAAVFCPKNQVTTYDFTLEEAFPLQGTVRYGDGTPVKKAFVFISPKEMTVNDKRFEDVAKFGSLFSRGAMSNAEGNFKIYLLPGEYEVFALNGQGAFPTVEIGPEKTPTVELTAKNTTLVRPIRVDGSPLFTKVSPIMSPINMAFWKYGPLNDEGMPTSMSIQAGGSANEDGNLEMCVDQETNLLFITNSDLTEGFAGEIPNNLENLAVFPVQLVPAAQARFRLVDAEGKPLAGQMVSWHVNLTEKGSANSGGLNMGASLQTDENGVIRISVPALGELKDRFYYKLDLSLSETNTDAEITGNLEFSPEKSGEILDVQEIRIR